MIVLKRDAGVALRGNRTGEITSFNSNGVVGNFQEMIIIANSRKKGSDKDLVGSLRNFPPLYVSYLLAKVARSP